MPKQPEKRGPGRPRLNPDEVLEVWLRARVPAALALRLEHARKKAGLGSLSEAQRVACEEWAARVLGG